MYRMLNVDTMRVNKLLKKKEIKFNEKIRTNIRRIVFMLIYYLLINVYFWIVVFY